MGNPIFETTIFNTAYKEIYEDYEKLHIEMRLFWENHRRNMNFYNEIFAEEFSTKHTDSIQKWTTYILSVLHHNSVEAPKLRLEISKITEDIYHHYQFYQSNPQYPFGLRKP